MDQRQNKVAAALTAYEPSLRERIGNATYDVAKYLGLPYANRMRGDIETAVDFIPGVGDAVGVNEAARDYQAGNYLGALGGMGLAAVGMVPAVGDVASKAIRDRFLMPAVWHDGAVYAARGTHMDALNLVPEPVRKFAVSNGDNRGYVNARGKFLDRYDAQEYALKHGLIAETAPTWAHTSPELISENLNLSVLPEDESLMGLFSKAREPVVFRTP